MKHAYNELFKFSPTFNDSYEINFSSSIVINFNKIVHSLVIKLLLHYRIHLTGCNNTF